MPISAECTKRTTGLKRYYKCLGRKRGSKCKKSMVRKEVFEKFVLDNLYKILENPKYMNEILNNLIQLQKSKSSGSSLLDNLIKEYTLTENSLNNIMTAVEHGIINNTTNKRMKELENQLEELDRQILLEKNKQSFEISKQDLEQFFLEALKLEPKLLIDYLVKEIKVYEDKLEIYFNSPIIKSPDNNQGFFLFTFNSKLPKFIQNKERPIMIDIQIRVYI